MNSHPLTLAQRLFMALVAAGSILFLCGAACTCGGYVSAASDDVSAMIDSGR